MNRLTRAFFPGVLAIAGALCAHFVPVKDLNWAVLGLVAAAVAFAFLDMYLAKKHHA